MRLKLFGSRRERPREERNGMPMSMPIMMSDIAFLMGIEYALEPEDQAALLPESIADYDTGH